MDAILEPGSETAAGRREDVFAIIDAAGELLDVPVLLEDTEFRVLAWSKGQHAADEERVSGILERHAQPWLIEALKARGVIARLISSPEPMFVEPLSAQAKPRMACRVQHDGPHLGYLWASTDAPFDQPRTAQFRAAAQSIAARMAQIGGQRTSGQDDLEAVLLGLAGADEAADRLGLSCVKATLLAAAPSDPAEAWTFGGPSPDVLRLYLATAPPGSLIGSLGHATYALLPWPASMDDAEARARAKKIAHELWDRPTLRERIVLAVSGAVTDVHRIPAARSQVDRVTGLQRKHPAPPRVAVFEDVQVMYALSRLRGALRQDGEVLDGVPSLLERHDRRNNTDLLATLRCYLDHFGDVNAAATRMHLHPNTFRYRLQRIREVSGFDPRNPEMRFLAELQLRLRDLG
ncbi:PucR family transcriptional regulator [Nonomuraea lactucae]|uniref:PucR family transcriptional regulator n=1 Tax=Nonomuraea lactucae TaxID=2249762 RepID=UPI000DE3D6D2|nr:helix-turn-helix domain-containing protein [Nonomuraea lactucae]